MKTYKVSILVTLLSSTLTGMDNSTVEYTKDGTEHIRNSYKTSHTLLRKRNKRTNNIDQPETFKKLTELEPSISELISLETRNHKKTSLEQLPDQLLSHIFLFEVDLSKLSKVCQKFNKICQPILQYRWDQLKDHPEARHIPMIMRLIETPESQLERLYRFFCQKSKYNTLYEHFLELNRSLSKLAGLNKPKSGDFTNPEFLLTLENDIDNFNLEQIWPKLRSIILDRPSLAGINILHANAQSQEIKDWLNSPDNNFAIQRITNLYLTDCHYCGHIILPCLSIAIFTNSPKRLFFKTKTPHNISHLPKELSLFSRARKIRLPHGSLREINLDNFINLIELILDVNNIKEIDLSKLTHLRTLNLDSNKLANIDISMLTNLGSLYLANNKIKIIDLSGLHNITTLDLHRNKLKDINLTSFGKFKLLNLDNNEIPYFKLCKILWLHTDNPQFHQLTTPTNKLFKLVIIIQLYIVCDSYYISEILNALMLPDTPIAHITIQLILLFGIIAQLIEPH